MADLKAMILAKAKTGATFTAMTFAPYSTKASSRISDLRYEGWPILDYWATYDKRRFKVYYMKRGAKQGVKA